MTPAANTKLPIAHSERDHAHCSASGADKWMMCTGCPAMCAKLPPAPSSKYADEGTQAHELSDKILKPIFFHYNKTGELMLKEFDMMDFVMFDNYPREMWDYIRYGYCDLIVLNVKEYKPKKVFIEQTVYLSKELEMFGTADCYFFFKKDGKTILAIFDLKYGKHMLVETSSPQLPYYAAAAAATHANQVKKIDEVWLNIYQPRAEHPSEEIHRQKVISGEDLADWSKRFLEQGKKCMRLIGKTEKQISPYLLAGDHCDWCDAQPICPAYKEAINKKLGSEFTEVGTLMPEVLENREVVPYDIDKDKLSRFLKCIPEIEAVCRNSKKLAITLMLAGVDIPDWKSVEGRSSRRWRKDEEGDVARGLVALGIEDPHVKKLRGLGQIETELRSKKGITKKAAGLAIAHLVEKKPPKLTLALKDDPRPAITGEKLLAGEFDSLEVEESESFEE